MKNRARIRKLEAFQPKKPYANVCFENGVFWRIPDGEHDYRASLSPDFPGNIRLSNEDVEALSKTHDFMIVVWRNEVIPDIPGVDNITLIWGDGE